MQLPFAPDEFFGVFADYNETVWPVQLFIYLMAFVAIYLAIRPLPHSGKIISAILASFWLWMGVVYHWIFFSAINPAARIFAALFVLEGILFIERGIVKNKLNFSYSKDLRSKTGMALMIFGPAIYPLLGYAFGHIYPYSPTFGLPCPTTIFTIGALLLVKELPRYLAVIPLLWSIIGFTAALSLGVQEDVSLLVAGIIGTYGLILRRKN